MSKILFSIFLLGTLCFGAINDTYSEYKYRVYSIGGDSTSSKAIFTQDKELYTALAFSQKNIDKDSTSTLGDFTIILLHVNDNTKQLKLSADYKNSEVVVKVYKSDTLFDESTLVYETSTVYLDDNYINQTIQLP